ncbi:MAG: amidase, partial [Actinobacteria bacterium]|nr:amidase [Actinomycetota bacterium]
GFIPFGRTNSCEWGSLPVTEPEAWGATRNPHDLSRTCGGSSGGAGSAVAAGIVALAHASDGGGSIRIPASCNGLVGLKPSRGRISMAPLGDEAGFSVQLAVTHTVADTAALLDAVHGPGVGDGVVAPPPERPYIQEVGASVGSLRIGLLDHDPHGVHVDVECRDAARNTAKLLESLGHHVEESWPDALNDASFPPRFGAMWATTQAVSRDSLSALLGRPATKDDIEAVNWEQAERASKASALDYAKSVAAAAMFRERPTQAVTPGERMGALHRTIQHVGATSDQPAARSHRDWAARRRATRGRLWARRPVVASGGATRICCPVEEFFAHRTRLTSRWANGHPLD